MIFERFRSDLAQIEAADFAGNPITAADLFSLFRDLCNDIRSQTGISAEKLPSGKPEELLTQLPWMGHLVTRHYNGISDQIVSPGRRAELNEQNEKLEKLSRQIKDVQTDNAALEKKQKEIENRIAYLGSETARKAKLMAECKMMEEQIQHSVDSELPQLEESHRELSSRAQELSAQVSALQRNVNALTQSIEPLSQKKQDLESQYSQLESQLRILEGWYQEMDLKQYSQKLKQMRQRCQCLTEVKSALETDLQFLTDTRGIVGTKPDPQLFREAMEELENQIVQYQALLAKALVGLNDRHLP